MTLTRLGERSIEFLVNRCVWILAAVLILTGGIATFIPDFKLDPTMKSGINTSSESYRRYLEFLERFGNEEFILIAVKSPAGVLRPSFLKILDETVGELAEIPDAEDVRSLTNTEIFREREGKFGTYPPVILRNGQPIVPDPEELVALRNELPTMDLLVSEDMQTVGIMVQISERARLHPDLIAKVLERIRAVLDERLPEAADYRLVGAPVLRHAIQRYNVQTALLFGILCTLICTTISIYIFKSIRVSVITVVVVGLCIVWILGIMAAWGIPLNSTTGLSFGMVLIVSVAAVIHIVTHFNAAYERLRDKPSAMKEAFRVVARPCLMCSLTTSTGFAGITISSIPMVKQLGVIMALGVLISYVLAILVAPALLIYMAAPSEKTYRRMSRDWVTRVFYRLEHFVFRHPRACVVVGLIIAVVMLAGAPRIHSDTQILRMLNPWTPEVKDLAFVRANLAPVHSLEVVVRGRPGSFKEPQTWRRIKEFEKAVNTIPETARTESLGSILQYLHRTLGEGPVDPDKLYQTPGMVKQLFGLLQFGSGGKEIVRRYVGEDYERARISVRIVNSPTVPIGQTIEEISEKADEILGPEFEAWVTGELAVFEDQASGLVEAQVFSLAIALSVITLLLIIQFRSIVLGLLSLIPNLLPLSVIFGLMGWLGISLDSVTVFAATITVGLSVDDTIHYLTQLQREVCDTQKAESVEVCLEEAYKRTGKALISTTAVLFFGFLMLLISPFRPVVAFGILGSTALLFALLGDVVFMPALILSVEPLRRMLRRISLDTCEVRDGCTVESLPNGDT